MIFKPSFQTNQYSILETFLTCLFPRSTLWMPWTWIWMKDQQLERKMVRTGILQIKDNIMSFMKIRTNITKAEIYQPKIFTEILNWISINLTNDEIQQPKTIISHSPQFKKEKI